MRIEKDYCDYDTCVALRELGYNAPQRLLVDYFGVYDEPQYDERIHLYDAQKWLREKGIFVHISHPLRVENDVFWNYEVLDEAWDDGKQTPSICASGGLFDSYEEALSEGLRASIKILQDEQKENN